jgi:hypothetical protein
MPRGKQPVNSIGYNCINVLVQRAIGKVKRRAKARVRASEHQKANRDAANTNVRRWKSKHRDQHLVNCKAYNDRPSVKQHALDYQKQRRQDDPVFRIKCRMRARLGEALRIAGHPSTDKVDNTLSLIGCTPDQLVDHLEKGGRNFDDKYDVDHVFAINSYDVLNDQLKYMNVSNTQLLTMEENRSKSKKLPTKAMAAKVDPACWPDGITEDMLPDIYPGWETPLRMHASGSDGAGCSTDAM